MIEKLFSVREGSKYYDFLSELFIAIKFLENDFFIEFEPRHEGREKNVDLLCYLRNDLAYVEVKRINFTCEQKLLSNRIEQLRSAIKDVRPTVSVGFDFEKVPQESDIPRIVELIQQHASNDDLSKDVFTRLYYPSEENWILAISMKRTKELPYSMCVVFSEALLYPREGFEMKKFYDIIVECREKFMRGKVNVIIFDVISPTHDSVDLRDALDSEGQIFRDTKFDLISAVVFRSGWRKYPWSENEAVLNSLAVAPVSEYLLTTLRKL
jgi:hypothetical protein